MAIEEKEQLLLHLASGDTLASDMLIVGKGVEPNSEVARQAGLQVNYGVLIDDYCCTSHADVYAAGVVLYERTGRRAGWRGIASLAADWRQEEKLTDGGGVSCCSFSACRWESMAAAAKSLLPDFCKMFAT
mgnify:CR=1 FL=1